MKVGDLVRYRGWSKIEGPLALVVYESSREVGYHRKIRVMWVGEELPVQAAVLSTDSSWVTTWVSPKHFELVSAV